MHMRKIRTTIALDIEVRQEAQRLAEKEGVDLADIIRRWIRRGRESEAKETGE